MEILVDRNGYEQFLSILNELKSSLENIASGAAEVCRDAVGDGWHDNFAYEELMRDEKKVDAQIKKMIDDKKYDIRMVDIQDAFWAEIDFLEDYEQAVERLKEKNYEL